MEIKVIGRWQDGRPLKCSVCMELERLVRAALEELQAKDICLKQCVSEEEYNSFGVVAAPLLVINGAVKMSGKAPPKEMLKELIKFELEKEKR